MLLRMDENLLAAQRAAQFLLSENLKGFRKAKGLSQEKLGQLAGVHRTQLGIIEKGTANPTLSQLVQLAFALNVEIEELFNKEPVQAPDVKRGRPRKIEAPPSD